MKGGLGMWSRIKRFLEGVFCIGLVLTILTVMGLLVYAGMVVLQRRA